MQIIDTAHKEAALLEGREVLALDSTQISTWLSCAKKYELSFVDHLTGLVEPSYFGNGKVVHILLEKFYEHVGKGVDRMLAVKLALDYLNGWLAASKETKIDDEMLARIRIRFLEYVSFWATERHQILGTEVGFSWKLLDTKQVLYVLEGKIDFLAETSEGPYWMDHKSQERTYGFYGHTPQFLNYSLALGCHTGTINYFGLQKTPPREGFFKRQAFRYSKQQLMEWKEELIFIFSEVASARRKMRFRKNRLECKHGLNHQCPFTHVCEQTDPRFEREVKLREFKVRETPWSPWSLEENHE